MLGIVGILCGLIIYLLYYYLTATYNFWKKHNIPGPKPTLFFGTIKDVICGRTILGRYLKNVYDAYEDAPFVGIFYMREPILVIKDPEHIKDVLIKDSALFSTRGIDIFNKAEPWNQFLFFMDGPMARILRTKISSAFTPSKLKELYHIMQESLERLDNYLEELLRSKNDHVINCGELAIRLTADMAGNNLMGIDMMTLTRGNYAENEFTRYSNKARGTYWSIITKEIMKRTCPRLYNWIGYYLFNNAQLIQFSDSFILNIMKSRQKHAIVRPNLLSSLIELKENPGKLSEFVGTDAMNEFLFKQMFGFFYAGYETSAVTICNTLYELALHHNIQDKLRKEILDTCAKNNGQLHYDDMNAMPYLNAVFKETLRKYPPADPIQREVLSNYTFKNTNITVPKKQKIYIPIYALHNDPKIYPQPDTYDPERFIDEISQSRNSMHYLPFGYGTRNCVGERIGILQTKLGLVGILRNYKLDVCEKTVSSHEYITQTFIVMRNENIHIKMTKIK